jgi:hypothetical protein
MCAFGKFAHREKKAERWHTLRMSGQVTYLGRVDFRNDLRVFGIKREDRFAHVYAIGKTGTGKSTLLEGMALQDLANGNGFALIDPLGDLAEHVASRVPSSRQGDLIYLNAADVNQPWGYNPLRRVAPQYIALAASGLMEVFKKMWPDAWGVRMEHILRNVLMALLEQPAATMHDILRMLSDNEFRKQIVRSLQNQTVRRFFELEYDKYSSSYRTDACAPIRNKVGAFLADPMLARMLTAPKREVRIRQAMDEGKVLIVNLAKGRIGEDSSSLLGGLLVTTIGLAAYTRVDTPPEKRRDFFVYIDEFQSFTALALANMLSENRKYRIGFVITHQYLHQLTPEIRHAVLGNAGTFISFRVGPEDASYVVRELQTEFEQEDVINQLSDLSKATDRWDAKFALQCANLAEHRSRPACGTAIGGANG